MNFFITFFACLFSNIATFAFLIWLVKRNEKKQKNKSPSDYFKQVKK